MSRKASANDSWRHLLRRSQRTDASKLRSDSFDFESSIPLTIIAGLNGSGKTRLISDTASNWPGNSEVISLHVECEHMLHVLRSREDIVQLPVSSDEFRQFLGETDRQDIRLFEDAIRRVVGRNYESIECYEIDYSNTSSGSASSEQTVPFFVVRSHGTEYTSLQMGLGELSAFALSWRIARLKQQVDADADTSSRNTVAAETDAAPEPASILVALDEPDAYLPPQGGLALLNQMAILCDKLGWSALISTHSLPAINAAHHRGALWVLPRRRREETHEVAVHSASSPDLLLSVIGEPNKRVVIFVEDESACALLSAILLADSKTLLASCEVFWVNGTGPLDAIRCNLPTEGKDSRIHYLFCYDGDARAKGFEALSDDSLSARRDREKDARTMFLPTLDDPDSLLMSLAESDTLERTLSSAFHRGAESIRLILDSLEGEDAHDWVNDLGDELGRSQTLHALSALWVQQADMASAHADVEEIIRRVRKAAK